MIGLKFGRLLVESFNHKTSKHSFWNCLCDCGNKHTASMNIREDKKRVGIRKGFVRKNPF